MVIRLRNDLYCVEWGVILYSLTCHGHGHAHLIQGVPKSKPLQNDQKFILYRSKRCRWITFIRQFKLWIKHYNIIRWYSMRDLLSDLNNYQIRKIAICVRYGKWCQSFLWHQLALQAVNSMSRRSFRWKFLQIFLFFWFSNMIFNQMRWF